MAHVVCPRCQRANPNEAEYCWFDGVVLRQGATPAQAGALPQEFVFPSQRRCRTLEEFVQGCQYEWEDACTLLRRREFSQYFTRIGRMDLARAAQEAESQADADVGLVYFLNNLPASNVPGPRLDLNPRRLNLGTWRPGESRQVRLQVLNQGKGLLQGKLTVAEGRSWLWIDTEPSADNAQCTLKAAREQQVLLRVDTRGLVAPQTYSARLTVITNGGIVEVPVRLELGSIPFERPPFQGVSSPRELAERMRTNPKPAVPLLEGGEIQRWFLANGWTYPVQGTTARGIAAVQQFFEAMGLSKPPPLRLSQDQLRCEIELGQKLDQQVQLRTTARKWVYAQVESNVPWLKVKTAQISGAQQATIEFQVDSRLLPRGERHAGQLRLVANAGQELTLPVLVQVNRPRESLLQRFLRPFLTLAGLALLYRVLLLIPLDLVAGLWLGPGGPPRPGTLAFWLTGPIGSESGLRVFVLETWWIGVVGGGYLVRQRTGNWSDAVTGAIAGTMAGVLGSATLACLVAVIETVPRVLIRVLLGSALAHLTSPVLGTVLWLALVLIWWSFLGGVVGLWWSHREPRGQRGRALLIWPLVHLGWAGAADLFLAPRLPDEEAV